MIDNYGDFMIQRILLAALLFLCVSCTASYKYSVNNPSSKALKNNKRIAITTSEDGSYGEKIYHGTGKTLSYEIREELRNYSNQITIFRDKENIDDFADDELESFDYIVVPEILHWEDRSTEWSGIPDRISFSIEIYDSQGRLLKSAKLQGKSRSMSMTSTDPEKLIKKPLSDFLRSCF